MTYLLFLLVLLLASPAWAVTYYVAATGGSDSNTCVQAQTHTTAKQTITAGIGCMSAGDRLEIKAGTYAEVIGGYDGCPPAGSNWASATTITRYQQDAVTVRGVSFCDSPKVASYIIIDGLTINANNEEAAAIWIGNSSHHIRVQNSTICCATSVEISTSVSGSGSNEFLNNAIYRVEAVGSHAIYGLRPNELYEGNNIYGFAGACIQIYTGDSNVTDNTIIRFNWCHDGSGGQTQGTPGASRAFILADGDNHRVYGNIVSNLAGRDDGCCGTIDILESATNAKIYNNTLYNNASFAVDVQGGSGHLIKNNILWQNCQAVNCMTENCSNADFGCNSGGTKANNLCDAAQSGCSIGGSNPLFVNAAGNNFHLQSGSPAKDAGTDLGAPYNVDYDGISRPQGSAWDIGAYEFVVSGQKLQAPGKLTITGKVTVQ